MKKSFGDHTRIEVVIVTGVHLEVVVQNLEKLGRLRDSPRLNFRPQGHRVNRNLKGTSGHKLQLDNVEIVK